MKRVLLGVAAVAVLALAAYVLPFGPGRRSTSQALEDRLVERVDRLWKLRIQGDWRTIYRKLMEPGIERREDLDAFVAKRGILRYLSYSIEKVKVKGSHADVTCAIEVKINHPVARDMKDPFLECVVTDRWVLVDGKWYKEYADGDRPEPDPVDQGTQEKPRRHDDGEAPADDRVNQ